MILSSQHIGLALYGLKSLSIHSDVSEINTLLSTLAIKIIQSQLHSSNALSTTLTTTTLPAQSFGMSMLGIAGCSSDRVEICAILSALTPRISELNPQSCGNVLYAMHKMKSNRREVRGMLSAIARIMTITTTSFDDTPMDAQELCTALFGLQGI